ncbi:V-type ATP synthase subunit E [Porcipelethomonas sp.]|uniref:V-type ATP synthase subunit E n=1 Tax=Porcipelethomonas sp. TaxID=2981675 RepID=UPI003EF96004
MDELQAEKLDRFMNSVNMEVDEKINTIIADAQTEKKRRIDKAEDEALMEAYNQIQKAVKETETGYRREFALRQQQLRMNELKYRDTLTDRIFEAVRMKINFFVSSDKYKEYILSLASDNGIDSNSVIMISQKDSDYKEILEQSAGCRVEVDPDIEIGGISIVNTEKGIVIDKTLDSAIEEQRKNFSSKYSFRKDINS